MSSSYSPDLRIELIGTGDQAGVWGSTTNTNLSTILETAIAGYTSVSVISANQALTANYGAADEARYAAIALTTVTGANFAVYAPPSSKLYVIYNASAFTATIANWNPANLPALVALGTSITIPAGKTMTVWSDGTNFVQQNTHLIAPTIAGGTLTSPALVTPALGTPASGTLTNTTGFPTANLAGAGAGVLTFLATPSSANLAAALTDETGTGSSVFSNSPTLVTPALGTPSALVGTNITGTAAGLSIGGTAATATSASTQSTGTNNTTIATTAFVQNATPYASSGTKGMVRAYVSGSTLYIYTS